MNLGKSLRVAVAQKGVKNIDVAKHLNVAPQQVTNWIASGKIKQENIIKLACFFEMPVSGFIKLGE